ncbi:transcriptional regulator family: Fungal Specific TF [Purpureocillium lilacinum]|uniref:Transcriptional regulator family: Fungal Specific TF n=1 Tax=Purpureocillium lilacinum TaxID=33203 RepID=A0ABR0BEX0_PURLI|nr:transcriptional regulator family: Fungal Specific TF [Purpureocillium lilacinum]
MVDVTYPPTKRRRQIHDRGLVPTMQQPSIPCVLPPEPGQTDGYGILSGGLTLPGADGRQIRPVAVDLPSPPPEDEQFEVLPSPNTAPCPPAAIATWTQALPFTGLSPFGQPVGASCDDNGKPPPTAMAGLCARPAPSDDLTRWLFAPQGYRRIRSNPVTRPIGASPFQDCPRKLGKRNHGGFALPPDGEINGYIKFSSRNKQGRRASTQGLVSGQVKNLTAVPIDYGRLSPLTVHFSSLSAPATVNPGPPCQRPTNMTQHIARRNSQLAACYRDNLALAHINAHSERVGGHLGSPQLLPESFGYEAKMDPKDRLLWTFYIKAWCPGRTILPQTNLWLKDFAPMHQSDGVRAAIQGLAGLYVYDYTPIDEVERRVIRKLAEAESCYSSLLANPTTAESKASSSEAITLAVILSMQDIVLTERRLKRPRKPRWLLGFQQAEFFLEKMSQAPQHRTTPLSSLCISQRVMVGRALILAQPMVPLPANSDPQLEVSRFSWLLNGSEQDLLEIHGGCGFSRKLLHMMSQITYCAARLQQDPENVVTPITAEYLLKELLRMRQWSKEFEDWETVKNHWLFAPGGYKIDSSADMTQATAEAWRLAAIIYLRCRVLRLPRGHPDVMSTLDNLAACIRVMPTSGFKFTAQAPLFPVFLLGVVATRPDHRMTSKTWFDEVVSTPVRSSVPPLYRALRRIWQWVDGVEGVAITKRVSWWELLVEEVSEREEEMLCLT